LGKQELGVGVACFGFALLFVLNFAGILA